jgi:hypothetical protein
VFLISDFQDTDFESSLKVTRRKHDVIPIVITDPRETEMPNVGLVRLQDAETGEVVMLDTASRKNRELFRQLHQQQSDTRDSMFRRLRLDPIHLETGRDLVEPLRRYFHRRESQQ